MRKGLIAGLLVLVLLVAGTALWHARFQEEPEGDVTRMAALGLMLLDGEEGVSVLAVKDRSVADKAGILPGDVLLRADDTAVTDTLQLEEMLLPARERMAIQLRRGREELITVWLNLR